MGRAKGCAEIYFGMGCEQKRGDRNEFRSTGRRGLRAEMGCGRVRRNSFRHGLGEDMGRAKGCAEIHFGMGCEQKRGDRNKFRSTGRRGVGAAMGERKGAPKFISAWVVSRSGVTEINFGQRAGVGCGRKWGAAGCAEIHFGMGCEQKRGDRNKFRSTGRRGAGADAGRGRVRRNSFRHGLGEDMGRPRGCAEMNFGMGWGRTRGDRNKFRSTCRRGAGADAGRAKGCAEIHFGMGWGRTRGDRNKFRSTGRRGAGADAGRGRVRRNSFRHGLGEDKGRPK
jgi:hypothetical protein